MWIYYTYFVLVDTLDKVSQIFPVFSFPQYRLINPNLGTQLEVEMCQILASMFPSLNPTSGINIFIICKSLLLLTMMAISGDDLERFSILYNITWLQGRIWLIFTAGYKCRVTAGHHLFILLLPLTGPCLLLLLLTLNNRYTATDCIHRTEMFYSKLLLVFIELAHY